MLREIYIFNYLEIILILLLFIIFNLGIIFFFSKYEKYFPIIDAPDNIRKKHKGNVKIFGGIILLSNLIILFFLSFTSWSEIIFDQTYFNDYRSFLSFFLFLFFMFIIGIYDDIYHISPYLKLILSTITFIIIFSLNQDLIINSFYSSTIDFQFELELFSYVFTILCFLLILNALNMFDGINLQAILLNLLFFIILIFFGNFQLISILLIICLLSILFLNYKEKIFLGDSGIYILASIITFFLIEQNTANQHMFPPELILQIFIIPALDMIRLFIIRIKNNQHPFHPDRKHLHHLLLINYSFTKSTLIIQTLIIIPVITAVLFNIYFFTIIFTFFSYLFLLIFLQKKIN